VPNIIAIVPDERIRRQVEQFVGQLPGNENRIATFKDAAEFESIYFPTKQPKVEAPPPPPKPEEEKKEGEEAAETKVEDNVVDLRLHSTVHIVLFASDAVPDKVQPWTSSLIKRMKESNYWPENNRSRLVLLKYEEDSIAKVDYLLPELDDMIYIPLDRLIFLQKLETLLALPKKTKGTFLFNQKLEQEIEISKICRLEKFNDIGLAVRNPLPLAPGLRAKFYVTLPGEKEIIRFFAKAVRSIPHPTIPQQYLCYFTFFGLRKKEVQKIRQWLMKVFHYKSLLQEDRKRFKFNPDDLMQVEMVGPAKNIIVIDHSEEQITATVKQIQNEMDNINIVTETSYSYFVHKYMTGTVQRGEFPPKPTKADQIPNGFFKFRVHAETMNMVDGNYDPGELDIFFGHSGPLHFKKNSNDWWKLIGTPENELIVEGALVILREKKTSSKVTTILDAKGEKHAVKFKISPDADEAYFSFEMSPVSSEEMTDKLGDVAELTSIDVMLIDAAFIPENFEEWLLNLKTAAVQKGQVKRAEDLRIILTSDRENRLERAWLDSPNVVGFLLKPFETRQLLTTLSLATHNTLTAYTFDNLGWADTGTNIHMSREIQIESVSEYGATLRSPTPFKPGSFFFLRKLIYDHAPNQCLCARVYFCEPHPKEKGQFQISALYFGINESFLKFARTWIRDSYAQSKAQGG
jgi:hypothetical protein